jgi:hypothetical protein
MFIANETHAQLLAPSGAKPGKEPPLCEAIALLRSLGAEKRTANYKHLAPLGRNK